MNKAILFLMSCLLLSACTGPHYADFFPHHDDGVRKPHVALLPIQNSTNQYLPWDLSRELSQYARYETQNNGMLYVYPERKLEEWLGGCSNIDFFSNDLAFTMLFRNSDYIVVADLIEHKIEPYKIGYPILFGKPTPTTHSLLSMKMRVRIIDVREEFPRIVLQEVLSNSYSVPVDPDALTREISAMSNSCYVISCYKLAYQKMIRSFVCRVEQVILSE